jgi:hypothetical protein
VGEVAVGGDTNNFAADFPEFGSAFRVGNDFRGTNEGAENERM